MLFYSPYLPICRFVKKTLLRTYFKSFYFRGSFAFSLYFCIFSCSIASFSAWACSPRYFKRSKLYRVSA